MKGVSSIRYKDVNSFLHFLKTNDRRNLKLNFYLTDYAINVLTKNDTPLTKLLEVLGSVAEDNWGKRIESDCIDIYTNDKMLFDLLSNTFVDETVHRFEPEGDPNLLSDQNICVVRQYPHGQYQYKVFLQPHKLNGDIGRKTEFLDWLDTQGNRIHITDAVKDWFLYTNWNWDRRYMYIDSEHTLLMAKMRESEALGRIHKYVLVDK